MNKLFKVQVKTTPRCDATGFKYFVFQVVHLKIETREAGRVTAKYCLSLYNRLALFH